MLNSSIMPINYLSAIYSGDEEVNQELNNERDFSDSESILIHITKFETELS